MVADIGRRLGLAGGLAILAATRQPQLLTLAQIAFGLGAGEGLFLPASYAIMPKLVTDDHLQSGNALLSAGAQLASRQALRDFCMRSEAQVIGGGSEPAPSAG